MITHVQLIPTVTIITDTRTATPDEVGRDECLWSVYIGEPGDFSWIADFADRIDAEFFANHMCETWAAELMEDGTV